MNHFHISRDRVGSPPPHRHTHTRALSSHPLVPCLYCSSANSDETFPGAENSLPPPCSVLYLHLLLPATVVCCFHRRLARRPLSWMSCVPRFLPIKVFCSSAFICCSDSHSLSPCVYTWPLQQLKNYFKVMSLLFLHWNKYLSYIMDTWETSTVPVARFIEATLSLQ